MVAVDQVHQIGVQQGCHRQADLGGSAKGRPEVAKWTAAAAAVAAAPGLELLWLFRRRGRLLDLSNLRRWLSIGRRRLGSSTVHIVAAALLLLLLLLLGQRLLDGRSGTTNVRRLRKRARRA